jgi:hypothetical protein
MSAPEPPPLELPIIEFGDGREVMARLSAICQSEKLKTACSNVPAADLAALVAFSADKSVENARVLIVATRLTNAVCNECVKRPEGLRACSGCKITFYCSGRCQKLNWREHRKWCCNPEAAVDTGPLRIVIATLKPTK